MGDIARQAVKLGTLPYAAMAQDSHPGVVILNYHQVGGGDARQLDMPAAVFEWQMDYLARYRRVVSLDEVVRIADGGTPPAEDVVALTFDDGYEDVYLHAFPILRRYGLPATIYISTGFIDEQRPFVFSAGERSPRGRPLAWPQIDEMAASGLIVIGSHTHSHADLSRLGADEIGRELDASNAAIARHLGRAPEHFAYPWGRVSGPAQEAVRTRYRTAAGGRVGKNRYGSLERHALRRVPVQRSDGRWFFRLKLDAWPIPVPSTLVPR